jgi:ATP-binding protein involved in chromosome partitioning
MKIIITAASKGGVGKSLVSINVAFALRKIGYKTGLLDSDIAMPAVVKYLNIENIELNASNLVEPVDMGGVQVLSSGLFMDRDQPVVIDAEKREALIAQWIDKTAWDVDYLVIDTPPGATDELAYVMKQRKNDLKGVVVVTTPSTVAITEVRRTIELLKRMKVPILGLIGNMTGFECEECHHMNSMFNNGVSNPIYALSKEFNLKQLVNLPMYPKVDTDPLHFIDPIIGGLKLVGL